jgi:hypothetical protein
MLLPRLHEIAEDAGFDATTREAAQMSLHHMRNIR